MLPRERIKHVVVLMLENRSFDHLLGFLQHPNERFVPLTEGQYANATGLTAPKHWGVTSDGRHVLQHNPPHGHASATMQLGRRGPFGGSRMDGFIKAYAQKVGGREEVPVIHWFRLALLALPVALVVGGLLNVDPFRNAPVVAILADRASRGGHHRTPSADPTARRLPQMDRRARSGGRWVRPRRRHVGRHRPTCR